MAGEEESQDRSQRGAPPSGVDAPAPRHQKIVDEDAPLKIRPGEKTPDPGERNAVRVPGAQWEENNRRQDTATRLAKDEPPVE